MKIPGNGELGNTKPFTVNDKALGGLPFSKGAIKDVDRLPLEHEIVIDRIPVFRRTFTQPILVSYLDSYTQAVSWNALDTNLRKFALMVERERVKPGSFWNNVLDKLGIATQPYNSFYFTITGTATHAWVFAFIHADSAHKPPDINGTPYLTPYPSSAGPGLPQFKDSRTVWMKDCFTMKYTMRPTPLVWACHVPVHPDCSYTNPNATTMDFCSGRYASSTGPFCDNIMQALSETDQQRLMRSYCEQNPSSSECEE